ncbi:protein-L-isoaspartate(D-aspartate) O-methyltransferase [bacterium]|nr:protein-L-isoaspartate(D-aspartate) O-methyltransferase [bacterium]
MLCAVLCTVSCRRREGMQNDGRYETMRMEMVKNQLQSRNIRDPRVLEAMRTVPRHLFVPDDLRNRAYDDTPLAIGFDQTISQPYIVAFMTEALSLGSDSRVLEIGTGSGYQAAVASQIAGDVYSIEIVEPLALRAEKLLKRLNYTNVHVKVGDGYAGWPEHAPFDAIILTAAPPSVPPPLIDQLAEGGRMVVPVGELYQELLLITKIAGELHRERLLPVRFVPMTGKIQEDNR